MSVHQNSHKMASGHGGVTSNQRRHFAKYQSGNVPMDVLINARPFTWQLTAWYYQSELAHNQHCVWTTQRPLPKCVSLRYIGLALILVNHTLLSVPFLWLFQNIDHPQYKIGYRIFHQNRYIKMCIWYIFWRQEIDMMTDLLFWNVCMNNTFKLCALIVLDYNVTLSTLTS